MARILINSAGRQTQPNIVFTKEIYHYIGKIDKVYIVHTDFSQIHYERTKEACSDLETDFFPLRVAEDDILAIQAELTRQVSIEDGDEIIVNITGGTKLMSIAIYDHFEKYGARIFYSTFGKNTYTQILPRIKNKEISFSYALNLKEYLTGYGVSIANPDTLHRLLKSEDQTRALYQEAINFDEEAWDRLNLIREGFEGRSYRGKKVVRGHGTSEEEAAHIESIFSFLDQIGFQPEKEGELTKYETRYLSGDWFEEYVYHSLKNVINLGKEFWGMGVQIRLKTDSEEMVTNEVDLALMLKNTLHMIECKTRMLSFGGENILIKTLYKADSLRSKFGLRVPVFLFTLADENEVAKGIARSRLNDITIINRDQIQDPEAIRKLFK